MISLNILDVKECMAHLLTKETFDHFHICEAQIKTGFVTAIDGRRNRSFYDSDTLALLPENPYMTWQEVKPYVFQLIKGKKTPSYFKIILMAGDDLLSTLLEKNHLPIRKEEIAGLFINLIYDNDKLTITTGVSMKTFTLDQSLNVIWDQEIKDFMLEHLITTA